MSATIQYNDIFVLKEDLAKLPEKMLEGALEGINQAADLIVGLAQVRVHVDTGSLRDSIRKERGGKGMHWRLVRVRAGGYVTNPKTKRKVDYAVYVEAKYPFLKPSVQDVTGQIAELIKRGVVEAVERG